MLAPMFGQNRSPLRPSSLLACCLAAGCAAGPAWTADEQRELAALQQAVLAKLADDDAELAKPASATLPDGTNLRDVDRFLALEPKPGRGGPDGWQEAWTIGSNRRLPAMLYRGEHHATVGVAGHLLRGFDFVHACAIDRTRGAVLVATRRGEQTVATAQSTWTGSLWHRTFRPELSADGSCFVYVEDGWFGDRVMLAPTDAPERGVHVVLPGVVQWPVWPGRDGKRLRTIVVHDGRVEVRDGDRLVATADGFDHAYYFEDHDQLRVHLTTDGRTRILFGDRLSPPLDSYRWIDESPDGRHWLAAGHDGDEECVAFDDQIVVRCKKLVWMDLADDGSTWACAVQEGDQCFVVRPGGRSGPFVGITHLKLAPDGSSLAVCTRVDRTWSCTLDGQPLGATTGNLDELILLPDRGGAVFTAHGDKEHWIVTPAARDGPWDRVGRPWLLADGKHVACLAQRGREVYRRVLALP